MYLSGSNVLNDWSVWKNVGMFQIIICSVKK